jgi:hypothetical protein
MLVFSLRIILFGFEVLTAVTMNSTVFWDVMPCSLLEVHRSFGGTYYFHLQDQPSFRNVSPGLYGVTIQTIAGCSSCLYIFRNSQTETWKRSSGLGEGQRNFDYMN